jgi:hypothetical protein
MHLHRFIGHVEADGAVQAVRVPLGDVALLVSRLDEAVFVAAMTRALAASQALAITNAPTKSAIRPNARRTFWRKERKSVVSLASLAA